MPSPFPGMDPFLEHPRFFPDLHNRLIGHLSEAIMEKLPEPYYAVLNERRWVETSERWIEPDVDVLYPDAEMTPSLTGQSGPSTAVIDVSQPIVITVPHDERREAFIDILQQTKSGERVVTTLELLSPSNKTPGENARGLYIKKQREVLRRKINLVEIDLLRAGKHTTAVPKKRLLRKSGPFDYHVCIAAARNWEKRFVYTIRMQDKLPEIAIPLRAKHDPIHIDLQAVFDRCYDAGPYRRRVKYELDQVVPPLSPEQAAWASQRIAIK